LHPERISMPCTCPHRDWLFYILYSSDIEFMAQIIRTAAESIRSEHGTPGVDEAVLAFLPSPGDCLHTLRIKVLVLMDRDEKTRRRLCEFTSPVVRNYSPVPQDKASNFYTELHDRLIPDWVKDETVTPGEFVDRVRMAYLIS
jgi:hypothetical protein